MEPTLHSDHRVRFKTFELDLRTRELRRNGIRLKLKGQPIDVLEMLLDKPGELVTREQLRRKLWPQDTFVDFEHNLNSAINRLRDALGDRAEDPRFIETLPRLGYRFIAPVDAEPNGTAAAPASIAQAPTVAAAPSAPAEKPPKWLGHWRWSFLAASPVVLLSTAGLLWYASQPLPPPHIGETVRITTDARRGEKWVIGTDGSRVFLSVGNPYGLGQVPVSGGRITTTSIEIPEFKPCCFNWLQAVSPDGSSVLVYGKYDAKENMSDLWIAETSGSRIRYLTRAYFIGLSASWSPDGKEVIYSTADGKIFTIPSEGGQPRLLRALDRASMFFAYSPDGRKIRFTYGQGDNLVAAYPFAGPVRRIWEMSSNGENLHEILPNWRPADPIYCGHWTADGDFFIFLHVDSPLESLLTKNQIWAIDERRGLLRRGNPQPAQLTSLPTTWRFPVPSRDGQKIFAEGMDIRGELVRFNRKTKQLEAYLGGMSAEMLDFSRDGKYLVYDSFPEGILWRANRDGSGIQQVAKAPHVYPKNPRISPDGSQIVFSDSGPHPGIGFSESMYLVRSQGGNPVRVLPDDTRDEADATWSPDGKELLFSSLVNSETKPVDPKTAVGIVDLATRKITYLPPAPRRAEMPRWSPDGRYIVCLTTAGEVRPANGLEVYDFRMNKWTDIFESDKDEPGWPTWSPDSRSVYYVVSGTDHAAFYRIPADGGRPELIADMPDLYQTGFFGDWFGIDPDGNPLALRDAGTSEVYALTLQR